MKHTIFHPDPISIFQQRVVLTSPLLTEPYCGWAGKDVASWLPCTQMAFIWEHSLHCQTFGRSQGPTYRYRCPWQTQPWVSPSRSSRILSRWSKNTRTQGSRTLPGDEVQQPSLGSLVATVPAEISRNQTVPQAWHGPWFCRQPHWLLPMILILCRQSNIFPTIVLFAALFLISFWKTLWLMIIQSSHFYSTHYFPSTVLSALRTHYLFKYQ